jgi:hypothetical protein
VVRALSVFRSVASALLFLTLLLGSGCDSLSEFKGQFTGAVVEGSFVRSGFSAGTTAELTFNATYAVGSPADIPKGENNWLTLRDEHDVVVFDAALDPIDSLSGDTLADFDFPGQKRLRNFIALSRLSEGPLAGRDATVVISLLATKHVEVRVIARGPAADLTCGGDAEDAGTSSEHPTEYYGLFKLK